MQKRIMKERGVEGGRGKWSGESVRGDWGKEEGMEQGCGGRINEWERESDGRRRSLGNGVIGSLHFIYAYRRSTELLRALVSLGSIIHTNR